MSSTTAPIRPVGRGSAGHSQKVRSGLSTACRERLHDRAARNSAHNMNFLCHPECHNSTPAPKSPLDRSLPLLRGMPALGRDHT